MAEGQCGIHRLLEKPLRLRGAGDRRGYAQFWTNGYSSSRPRFSVGYRRRIGENGDLFLFAPTFLSPIGPLTDAFFDR